MNIGLIAADRLIHFVGILTMFRMDVRSKKSPIKYSDRLAN